jgi:ABC-type dipeptide/oligopeptide/nickel transport system permease component
MGVYVVRRAGWAVLLVWLVTVFTFVLSHVIPGNPAAFLAGFGATRQEIRALAIQMGLTKPLIVQYGDYMGSLFHLQLGTSAATGDAVTTDLAHYLPATVELVVISFALYVAIAVPLGTWAAHSQGRLVDVLLRVATIVGSGVPVFWLGILLQELFFARLGWLPDSGELPIGSAAPPHYTGMYLVDSAVAGQWGTFGQAVLHLVLPVATIVIAMLAVGLRSTRASVLQELGRPYVRTARSKGMGEARLLTGHVMRNALNPVISLLSLQFGYLLGWVVLVETVFDWPGIGLYTYNSIQSLDYDPIMAVTLLTATVFIVVNLLADLAYPLLDPKIRDAGS